MTISSVRIPQEHLEVLESVQKFYDHAATEEQERVAKQIAKVEDAMNAIRDPSQRFGMTDDEKERFLKAHKHVIKALPSFTTSRCIGTAIWSAEFGKELFAQIMTTLIKAAYVFFTYKVVEMTASSSICGEAILFVGKTCMVANASLMTLSAFFAAGNLIYRCFSSVKSGTDQRKQLFNDEYFKGQYVIPLELSHPLNVVQQIVAGGSSSSRENASHQQKAS